MVIDYLPVSKHILFKKKPNPNKQTKKAQTSNAATDSLLSRKIAKGGMKKDLNSKAITKKQISAMAEESEPA